MAGWLAADSRSAVSSEPPSLHGKRLNVRGPPVKVRVHLPFARALSTDSHAYELQVRDLTEWLETWNVDAVKKNVQTYVRDHLNLRILRRHFKLELWLPIYGLWEPLPYDADFQEVATRYNLDREQEYWDFVLRFSNGRTIQNCGDW